MFKCLSRSMIRSIATFSASVSMLAIPMHSLAAEYTLDLNKTQVLHLPAPAAAVIVGNPKIADISVHSSDTLFVMGRGYGVTNIVVLNDLGETIMNADILVKNNNSGVRILKMGKGQESYNCAPYCLPAPVLGDMPGFVSKYSGRAKAINNTVASAAPFAAANTVQTGFSATGQFPPRQGPSGAPGPYGYAAQKPPAR